MNDEKDKKIEKKPEKNDFENKFEKSGKKSVFCVGGVIVDNIYKSRDPIILKTSNPGNCDVRVGGVAHNVCINPIFSNIKLLIL